MKMQRTVLIGLLSVLLGLSCSTESQIKHYSGEGQIKARPDYGFPTGGGGYVVQFEPLKLDRATHVTYRFEGLPHWKAEIFLAVEDSRRWTDRREYETERADAAIGTNKTATACRDDLIGRCAMVLKDADGKVLLRFNKKLSELTWSRAGQGPWALYDQDAVNFTPKSREYLLEVTIEPDPLLKGTQGYVLIRGGGRETVPVGF